MPATIAQARDQMCGLLKTALDASSFSTMQVLWDNVDGQPDSPNPELPWARAKIKHATGGQKGFGSGLRRYERTGTIVVQLFTPGGKGLGVNDQLVTIILAAYEGKTTSGGIVFKQGRSQEVGQDGPWFQTNVFLEFSYDDIK